MPAKTIRAVLDHLITIQKALTIDEPQEVEVVAAYKFVPEAIQADADNSWFQNEVTLAPIERGVNLLIQTWTIHTQYLFRDADRAIALDVAGAMLDEYMDALNTDIDLGGTVTRHDFQGGSPTLATIRVGNIPFQGFDVIQIVELKEGTIFA